MENIQQMSMLEVAVKLMSEKKMKQPISKIITETLEMKGIDDPNGDYAAQLYIDITMSSKFVYMGDNEWDLKSRQSLDEYDKDGSAFNVGEEIDDTEEEISDGYYDIDEDTDKNSEDEDDDDYEESDDYDDEDEDDEYDEDSSSEDASDLVTETYDEDDETKYMDEDSYNDIMDDYEDMYDKE